MNNVNNILPYFVSHSPEFRSLNSSQKLILYVIYCSNDDRFTISQISRLADIDKGNCSKYIKILATKDFIDIIRFGSSWEVLKK